MEGFQGGKEVRKEGYQGRKDINEGRISRQAGRKAGWKAGRKEVRKEGYQGRKE
jgi:hypothetical protein